MESAQSSLADLIGTVSWLRDVSPEAREQLARGAERVYWEADEVVFREHDEGAACYVLQSGAVKVSSALTDGRRITLALLTAPAVFGELALLGAGRRSATVEAVEPSQAVVLEAEDVLGVLRDDGAAALGVARALAERLLHADERVRGYALGTAAGGVCATLLAWVEARQAQGAGTREVEVIGGPTDVARQSGISREATMRFMDYLELEGTISLRRGRTVVHDPAALTRYLG